MARFAATRLAVGAQGLGIARAAYEFALDYVKERKQFGRAIIEDQAIAFKLANMKISVDASRLLIWAPRGWPLPRSLFERRRFDFQSRAKRQSR